MKIRILIADDHRIVRDGLHTLIDRQSDMEVVGEAENGSSAVRLTEQLNPDLIIMDVSMPDLNGIEATRDILAENPDAKVLALSMHSDRRYVTEMMQAGALGYMLKDCAFEELAAAIRSVNSNRQYLSPAISLTRAVRDPRRKEELTEPSLSKRQFDILRLLTEGKTISQIASVLKISPRTVETHRRNMIIKLDVNTTADLVRYALKEGICSA